MIRQDRKLAIAVYCGSSRGRQEAYVNAALSLGRAIANNDFPLVYGGGTSGLMGVVSNAVLEAGGIVTGVIPYAIQAGGGEGDRASRSEGPSRMEINRKIIIVNSMHERKVEMARRSLGFVGLPGGFGTFEEIMEVSTWTQLGIHKKPVVLLNVLSFFEPLRQLVQRGIAEGFIRPENEDIIVFVDGPASHDEHMHFDWGHAAVIAIKEWQGERIKSLYQWEVQTGVHRCLDIA